MFDGFCWKSFFTKISWTSATEISADHAYNYRNVTNYNSRHRGDSLLKTVTSEIVQT